MACAPRQQFGLGFRRPYNLPTLSLTRLSSSTRLSSIPPFSPLWLTLVVFPTHTHTCSLAQPPTHRFTHSSTQSGPVHEAEYHEVLTSMVGYLRDHDCYATLSCLLASAARNGVVLTAEDGIPLSPNELSSGGHVWNILEQGLGAVGFIVWGFTIRS